MESNKVRGTESAEVETQKASKGWVFEWAGIRRGIHVSPANSGAWRGSGGVVSSLRGVWSRASAETVW